MFGPRVDATPLIGPARPKGTYPTQHTVKPVITHSSSVGSVVSGFDALFIVLAVFYFNMSTSPLHDSTVNTLDETQAGPSYVSMDVANTSSEDVHNIGKSDDALAIVVMTDRMIRDSNPPSRSQNS